MSPADFSVLLAVCSALLAGEQAVLAKPFDTEVKVCSRIDISYNRLKANFNRDALRKDLLRQVNGCQFVNGDLSIQNFNANPNNEAALNEEIHLIDTDFLDSIEEIAGRLLIFRVNIAVLTLKNLRAVRGVNFESKDEFYPIDVRQNPYLESLELPKLTAITGGNVRLIGSMHRKLYHFLTQKVNWDLISEASFDGIGQPLKLIDQVNTKVGEEDAYETQCHSNCGAYCWSSSWNGCQMDDHVCSSNENCPTCYSTLAPAGRSNKACCHASCLGGCSGPGPGDCHSCRQFNRNGSCDSDCQVGCKVTMWKLASHLCVSQCTLLYLLDFNSNTCVSQCPESEKPQYGACSVCETCKTCQVKHLLLTASAAKRFQSDGCNQWRTKSSLEIGHIGFSNKNSGKSDLASLEILNTFYGRLIIKRVELMGVDNVGFLRNLEYVSESLVIMIARVRYLGLVRLQYAKVLMLINISGLCSAWYPAQHIDKMSRLFKVSLQGVTFDNSSGECLGAVCDSRCRGRECWGPGPDMCVKDNLWTPENTH